MAETVRFSPVGVTPGQAKDETSGLRFEVELLWIPCIEVVRMRHPLPIRARLARVAPERGAPRCTTWPTPAARDARVREHGLILSQTATAVCLGAARGQFTSSRLGDRAIWRPRRAPEGRFSETIRRGYCRASPAKFCSFLAAPI